MLNQTKPCSKCQGKGTSEVKKAKNGQPLFGLCRECNGSGVQLDDYIVKALLEAGLQKSDMAKTAEKIFNYCEHKLKEAYDRGYVDGLADMSKKK